MTSKAEAMRRNRRQPSDAAPSGPLTQVRLKDVLHYEPSTGEWRWLKRLAWRIDIAKPAGSFNTLGYRQIKVDGKVYLAHRLAWFYMTGEWPSHEIDHRDLDRANCAWENLRPAQHSENACNVTKRKTNSSGFKGVWRKRNKWAANFRQSGRTVHLGSFDTPEEAAAAYDRAAAIAFGDFHRQSA